MNRYDVFIRIVETGSFTQAAAESGYTQSAVSQMIRTLEHELNTTLFLRSKTGAELTPDGREYLPYIQSVSNARRELDVKCQEMQGLERGLIRVGTFTSVSRTWLPRFIKEFKKMYPSVQFILRQGDYTSICQWVAEGSVDFGFTNPDVTSRLTIIPLCTDRMQAVLPPDHYLAGEESISLKTLASLPYILLDEGVELSVPLSAFYRHGLNPNIQYTVVDDYTVMSMVEQGLGISIMNQLITEGHICNVVKLPLSPPAQITMGAALHSRVDASPAVKMFLKYAVRMLTQTETT